MSFLCSKSSESPILWIVQARALPVVYGPSTICSVIRFLRSPLLTVLQFCWPHCLSNMPTYWHLGTFALFVLPSRTLFSPISTWLIPSPPSNLCSTVTFSTSSPIQSILNYISPPLPTLPLTPYPILFFLHSTHHLLTSYIVYIFIMFIVSSLTRIQIPQEQKF